MNHDGKKLHASKVPDRLEATFNLRSERTELLQSEVDIRAQELLKHREEFMDRLKYNGLQRYAKSIPFLTDDLRIYNSDAFEKEVPTKQTSLHAALMATKGSQDKQSRLNSRAMEEYNHFLACGEFPSISDYETSMEVAGIADVCELEDTEPEPSTAPQDDDYEDPDSDTSGLFKEEPVSMP